jgi:hypothetical protein
MGAEDCVGFHRAKRVEISLVVEMVEDLQKALLGIRLPFRLCIEVSPQFRHPIDHRKVRLRIELLEHPSGEIKAIELLGTDWQLARPHSLMERCGGPQMASSA